MLSMYKAFHWMLLCDVMLSVLPFFLNHCIHPISGLAEFLCTGPAPVQSQSRGGVVVVGHFLRSPHPGAAAPQ